MAAMAGLGVLLDTTTASAAAAKEKQQQLLQPSHGAAAQVVSKGASLNAAFSTSSRSSCPQQLPVAPAVAMCGFLQRCFLCHRELADGKDIYIYRGDRAFCSEDCRCQHILEEESDDGGASATNCAAAGRCSRRRQAVAGGFAF